MRTKDFFGITHACFDVCESRNMSNISFLHCALSICRLLDSQLWLSKRLQIQVQLLSEEIKSLSNHPFRKTGLLDPLIE